MSNLANVLNERGLVYGSGHRLMGLHAGLEGPIQIGPEHSGIIVSLAYANGSLYLVERTGLVKSSRPSRFDPKINFAEDSKNFTLIDSLSGERIRDGIDDIANYKGMLIAVTSNPQGHEHANDKLFDLHYHLYLLLF